MKSEYLDGWCEFSCPDCGFLAVAPASSSMLCGGKKKDKPAMRCNRLAVKSYGKHSKKKPPVEEGFWAFTKALQIGTSLFAGEPVPTCRKPTHRSTPVAPVGA